MAQAAAEAATRAEGAAGRSEASMQAIRDEAGRLNLNVPEELIAQIGEFSSSMTIDKLREMGALRDTDTPPAEPGTTPPAADNPPGEPDPPADPPADPPEPGRKKTLAERYLGI